ncbi:ANTAR domain-containing protein [Streptomyces sp. NPDC052496]|uniref:ANTAR domain-containing protein n=1 Tax=Streptomyces sp. NPDC052496 TaxID=3154951 RepID=UPI00342794B9
MTGIYATDGSAPESRTGGAAPRPAPGPTDFAEVFRAHGAPLLVLDTDLVISDANPAYLDATRRRLDELVGRYLFEAFPENPDDPESDGKENLQASLRRVLHHSRPDVARVHKYDIPWTDSPTGFDERYWSPATSPLYDQERKLTGLLHHVEDVTPFHREVQAVCTGYDRTDTPAHDGPAQRRFAVHLAAAERDRARLAALETEVAQLKAAQGSRATIDQAVGIVMVERRIAPDDAFQLLVALSQRTNVKLRNVAAALVRRAAGRSRDTGSGTADAP